MKNEKKNEAEKLLQKFKEKIDELSKIFSTRFLFTNFIHLLLFINIF